MICECPRNSTLGKFYEWEHQIILLLCNKWPIIDSKLCSNCPMPNEYADLKKSNPIWIHSFPMLLFQLINKCGLWCHTDWSKNRSQIMSTAKYFIFFVWFYQKHLYYYYTRYIICFKANISVPILIYKNCFRTKMFVFETELK